MANTQPGGLYLAPDGKTYHDAWNRPVEQGATSFSPPAEDKTSQPIEAGLQAVGGQIDTPFPGSDLYREHEARMRQLAEDLKDEQERFAKEQEKIRKQVPITFDPFAFAQQMAAIAAAGTPRSGSEMNVSPTREEHKAAGEAWAEREQEKLDRLDEVSLATSTNVSDPKDLEEGGQTKGESDMKDSSKKRSAKKEE